MKKKIWTMGYFPFTMGGEVNRPISCEMEVGDSLERLGKGYLGYIVKSPSGKTFIVESTTGGIVGSKLEDVQRDINSATAKYLKKQIAEELEHSKTAQLVSPDVFWKMLRAA